MGYKKKLNIEKKCLHVMFLGNAEKSADKKLISDLWKNVSLGTCLTHKQQK